jgi:predicted transposase/invertase (TIGR01784 family)
LENWLRFFAAKTEEEYTMAAQTRPATVKAWGTVQYLSGDEEARRLAEYKEMARRDEVDRYEYALKVAWEEGWKEGWKEGIRKGREELQFKVARRALRENMDHSKIAFITDLSLEEIKQLAAGLT